MSGFSAQWLALREPADAAARSARLACTVTDALSGRSVVRGLDLAAGTGSNVRYLAPRLPASQEWLLVDGDARLLAAAAGLRSSTVRQLDLGRLEHPDIFDRRDLVTASALLDLVSDDWLESLARQCRRVRAVVLLVLTYDGRIRFTPEDPDDQLVRSLVNRHQKTDKGFGPALGPDAAARAAHHLRAAGYDVQLEPSDWVLPSPGEAALQRALIEGWAAAASEIQPADAGRIEGWATRRLARNASGRSDLVVGHIDLAATVRE
jgi:hypothetical protein